MPHAHAKGDHGEAALDATQLENEKIAGAIKTDFILSAEIMAITLASVSASSFWTQALVLAIVGIGMTVFVYGIVALIVKANDAGVALAQNERPVTSLFNLLRGKRLASYTTSPRAADQALRPVTQGFGRGLVFGMPHFLKVLSAVGTAAMLWVGGGIIIHGFAGYGLAGLEHLIHDAAMASGKALAFIGGLVEWLVTAGFAALLGLAIGGAAIVAMHYAVAPMLMNFRRTAPKAPIEGRSPH